MNLEITRITAIIQQGRGDKLFLHTNIPSGAWPFNETAVLTTDVAADTYVEYCRANFPGVPLTVVRG